MGELSSREHAKAVTVHPIKDLPTPFRSEEELDEFMSRPTSALVDDLASVEGDIAVIGVGGKMGPTLARMAKRADPSRRVYGIARFSDDGLPERLEGWGVQPIRADLLERNAIAALPVVPNVIFMAGPKFGSTGGEDLTWAMNA